MDGTVTMDATSGETRQLAERIAATLRSADLEEGERHVVPWADLADDNEDRLDYLRLAAAVLADLDIEQVGFMATDGDGRLPSVGRIAAIWDRTVVGDLTLVPVYRLATSGRTGL